MAKLRLPVGPVATMILFAVGIGVAYSILRRSGLTSDASTLIGDVLAGGASGSATGGGKGVSGPNASTIVNHPGVDDRKASRPRARSSDTGDFFHPKPGFIYIDPREAGGFGERAPATIPPPVALVPKTTTASATGPAGIAISASSPKWKELSPAQRQALGITHAKYRELRHAGKGAV